MDKRIEKAILFIAKKFHTDIKLKDLAEEANLSEFHFHRLFKEATNETPLGYINRVKIGHAAHLLILFPNTKYFEIAFECGFSSPATFSRAFKDYYGKTPSLYRKEAIHKNNKNEVYQNKGENIILPSQNFNIPIKYVSHRTLLVKRVSLVGNSLEHAYKEMIIKSSAETALGFYVDMPFHVGLEKSRHYIGENKEINKKPKGQFIEIPSGFYTYLNIKGDYSEISQQVISFKQNYIDPSPYSIKSTFAFEQINLPKDTSEFHYFSINRKLFISVKKN